MALFQVSRKVLRPLPSGISRFSTMGQKQQTTIPSMSSFQKKQPGFDLPNVNSAKDVPQQGWSVSTIIHQSRVQGAGKGRFAIESVQAKSTVFQKMLVSMAKIDSLSSLENDVTISFETAADLEKYIDLCSSEGGYTRDEVLNVFTNYLQGFDGKRALLSVSSTTVNHADHVDHRLNVVMSQQTLPGGGIALVGEALVDIQVNDELVMDHRKFNLPEFYQSFAKEHGCQDARTATIEAELRNHDVYGGAWNCMAHRQAKSVPVQNKEFADANWLGLC